MKMEETKEFSIESYLDEEFKTGSKLLSLHHYESDGVKVDLELDEKLIPYINPTINLLSPHERNTRNLLFMYVGEMIEKFREMKKEGMTDPKLLSVIETLLIGMRYLTSSHFIKMRFTQTHKEKILAILTEVLNESKYYSLDDYELSRPKLHKTNVVLEDGKLYCMDEREKRDRLYMAVFYRKVDTKREEFTQVAFWLSKLFLRTGYNHVPFEEIEKQITEHELHEELLFYLNRVQITLCWLMNTYSFRENRLELFDEMEIVNKLGIPY